MINTGEKLGKAFLDTLGLPSDKCMAVYVEMRVREPVVVEVEYLLPGLSEKGEVMAQLREFNLVDKDTREFSLSENQSPNYRRLRAPMQEALDQMQKEADRMCRERREAIERMDRADNWITLGLGMLALILLFGAIWMISEAFV